MIQNKVLTLFALVVLAQVLPNSLAIKCNTVAKDAFQKCDTDADNCIYLEETEAEGDFKSCLWWRVGGKEWYESSIGKFNLTAKGSDGETTYVISNWTGLDNTYQGWEGMGSFELCQYFKGQYGNTRNVLDPYMYGAQEGTRRSVNWSDDVKLHSDGSDVHETDDVANDKRCCSTDNCNRENQDTPLGFSITAANIGKELGAASVLMNSMFVTMFGVMAMALSLA